MRISNVIKIPTMTGTVFNLGLNDKTVQDWRIWSDMEFALDCCQIQVSGLTAGWVRRNVSDSYRRIWKHKKKASDEDGEDYSEEAVLFETAMQYKSIILKRRDILSRTNPLISSGRQ